MQRVTSIDEYARLQEDDDEDEEEEEEDEDVENDQGGGDRDDEGRGQDVFEPTPLQKRSTGQLFAGEAPPLKAHIHRRLSVAGGPRHKSVALIGTTSHGSGDMSMRRHFLKERSATLVDLAASRIEPLLAPVPQSKAGAFLLSVLAKARGSSIQDMKRGDSLHTSMLATSVSYANHNKEPEGPPLRKSNSTRRLGVLARNGLDPETHQRASDLVAAALSNHERSLAMLVGDLRLQKKQLTRQVETLQTILLHLADTVAKDTNGVHARACRELVEAGVITELSTTMREFRFHSALQICAVSVLSLLADASGLYAYMMGLLEMDALLQKTMAVHATHERLVAMAATLAHAISEARTPDNARAHRAMQTEQIRRPSLEDMQHICRNPISHNQRQGLQDDVAMRGRRPSQSASSLRRTLALTPAPTLSAHYDLEVSHGLASTPTTETQTQQRSLLSPALRPMTSPASVTRAASAKAVRSDHLAIAAYTDSLSFVEPSPLSKRMGKSCTSLGLGSIKRTRVKSAQTPRRKSSIEPTDSKEPKEESNATTKSPPPETTTTDGVGQRDVETPRNAAGEDDDEEESYEDDFTSPEDSDDSETETKNRDRLQADAEFMDLLHHVASEKQSPTVPELKLQAAAAEEAAIRIQSVVRGRLVRRTLAKKSTSNLTGATPRSKQKPRRQSTSIVRSTRKRIDPKMVEASRVRAVKRSNTAAVVVATAVVSKPAARRRSSSARKSADLVAILSEVSNQVEKTTATTSDPSELEAPPQTNQEPTESSEEPPASKRLTNEDTLRCIQNLYAQGLAHHKAEELPLAIECYTQALSWQKQAQTLGGREFASLYINLGSAFLAQQNAEQAFEALTHAQRIQPNNVKAIYNTALALVHLGRPSEAKDQLRQVLVLDPSHAKALDALARLSEKAESSKSRTRRGA